MRKPSTPPRNVLVLRKGDKGVKPLCNALLVAGLSHGKHFSASTDESIITNWVHNTGKSQLLIIDPSEDTELTTLIAKLKKKNAFLSVTVIGIPRSSSAGIDRFIDVDVRDAQSLKPIVELVREFNGTPKV